MFKIIVFFLLIVSILLPIIYFFINKEQDLSVVLLIVLFGIGGCYELIFSMILNYNTEIWFKIYPFLEFIALLYFFRKLIGLSQSVFYIIIGIYSVLFIYMYYLYHFKISSTALELFIPITHCLLVFTGSTRWTIQQFEKLETSSLLHFPVFYILSGMILYYSGTFFIFGLETIFRYTKSPVLLYFWYINLLLLFIYRLSFYIAIWKAKKV
ncbi:hypothetical protein [Flavobacterium sp.]|uniref:hypothetical protein n=1 Tax=Flavobacterium sp. TaxID=239 RepID=UPI00333F3952